MSRASFDDRSEYAKTVDQLPSDKRAPCMWCKEPTLLATLSQYGARCFRCYESFCAEGSKGGMDGFLAGAPDTDQQREMHGIELHPEPAVTHRAPARESSQSDPHQSRARSVGATR